jgi:heat shock protein HslJ
MTRRRSVTLTALAVASVMFGCAPSPLASADEEGLTQREWLAETINGKPVITPGRVTLTFKDGRVSGRAGCNQYSGPAEYGKAKLNIGPLVSTKMACTGAGIMQQESEFLATLQTAENYAFRSDNRLLVTGSSGGSLIFTDAGPGTGPK